MNIIRILVLLTFSNIALHCQVTRFYVQTDAEKIIEGSTVQIEFVLENGDGSSFSPPQFKGFDIISGPNRSSSFKSVNGVISRSLSYSYVLMPRSAGSFTIGVATIRSDGRTLNTRSVEIEVISAKEPGQPVADLQVETLLSDSIAYVGQQVLLEYKLVTTLDVRSVNFLSENELTGFYQNELPVSRNFKREIIGGREYMTLILKRTALFPQQTGNYTVEPVNISLGINTGQSSRSFFFTPQLDQKIVKAEGISITVRSKPPSGLISFSGATGAYSMRVSTQDRDLTTDDAITLNMEITGNGDSRTVSAPDWDLPATMEMYDPNLIVDEVDPQYTGVRHRKVFEYLIVPSEPGSFMLYPEFTYFDPDSNSYITITETIGPFTITKGSGSTPNIRENEEQKISPIFTTTRLKPLKPPVNYKKWLIRIFAFICLMAILLLGIAIHLQKKGIKDPLYLQRKKARAVATERLKKAQSYKEAGDLESFYTEISFTLKKYLDSKYDIPAQHLTKNELAKALEDKFDSEISMEASRILDRAEYALYAPGQTETAEDMYTNTLQLISTMESRQFN